MTFIIFLIILGVLVLVHEFGHYIVAKWARVKVDEFAFGFPPTLWSKKYGETKYQLNLIPFGGYVKLHGEDGSHNEQQNSFAHKTWWQKSLIIMAGIFMNLVLGGVLLGIAFMFGLPVSGQTDFSYPGSNAKSNVYIMESTKEAIISDKVVAGDKLLSVNDQSINTVSELKQYLQTNKEKPVTLSLERKNNQVTVTATPKQISSEQAWQLGLGLTEEKIIKYPFYYAIPMGFVEMFRLLIVMIVALFTILQNLIMSRGLPTEIAGPVGIYQIAGAAKEMGLVYLIQLTAALSINLAIINALPLPALDGGRFAFIIFEKISGKKVPTSFENIVHTLGFFALIGLIILVTISDVRKLF